MRSLLFTALLAGSALAQTPATAPTPAPAPAPPANATPKADATPATPTTTTDAKPAESPAPRPSVVIVRDRAGCADWAAAGLPEGPLAIGYAEADIATGRRACPRTELGIGTRFGAIIDTANFYGNLGLDALVFGSLALNEGTELYATLEAVDFQYAQTALKTTSLSLGNLTVGATRVLYGPRSFVGAVSARLLLPTASGIPGARTLGAEVGHASTWRAHDLLEVHTWVGVCGRAVLAVDLAVGGPRRLGTLRRGDLPRADDRPAVPGLVAGHRARRHAAGRRHRSPRLHRGRAVQLANLEPGLPRLRAAREGAVSARRRRAGRRRRSRRPACRSRRCPPR